MKYAPSYQQVKSVELLGSEAKVVWEMKAEGLQVSPPADLGTSTIAWSFFPRVNHCLKLEGLLARSASK